MIESRANPGDSAGSLSLRLPNGTMQQKSVSQIREISRGAGVTLLLRVAGGGFEFLLNLLIARMFGAEGAGMFYVALTVTTIGSVFARLGLDNSLLRLGALHAAAGEWGLVKSASRRGLQAALFVAIATSVLLYLGSSLVMQLRPNLGGAAGITQLMLWAIMPVTLVYLYGELLKSIRWVVASQIVAAVVMPAITLGAIVVVNNRFGLTGPAIGYVAAAFVAALSGWLWWRRAMAGRPADDSQVPWHVLFKGTGSLLWIKATRMSIGWLATGALVAWSSQAEVGIFNVALRISLALGLLLMSVNSIVAPKFAALLKPEDKEHLEKTAQQATWLVIICGSPVVGLFLFAPAWVMHWFGSEFATQGAGVLFVLALGQCVNLLTGPVNYLLMMSGNEQALSRNMSVSLGVGVTAMFVLIPRYGALGAAIATSLAMTLQNLVSAQEVRRRLGIVTIPFMKHLVARP